MIRWYLISVSLVWTLVLSGQADNHREFLAPYNFHVDSVSLLATWESPEDIDIISLFNPIGKLILKKMIDEKQVEIPVAAYTAGVYMIRAEMGKVVISKKIVIMY